MANRNYTFHSVSTALPVLLNDLLNPDDANEVGSRNGRTVEKTHVAISLDNPLQREVMVPYRRVNLAAQIAESAWVLAGRDDVEWLGHYLPRAKDYSDDGLIWRGGYGKRLRAWPRRDGEDTSVIDQLAHVVELLRNDPLSRRAVIAIYDPQVDTHAGKDIPCNDFLVFTNRLGALDLSVTVRSNDVFWGWSGINAFEWSVLQEVVATLLGVQVGKLHFSTASLHLYDQHWKRAREVVAHRAPPRIGKDSPRLELDSLEHLDDLLALWFTVEEGLRTGDPAALEGVESFPEPMLQSWLRVLAWWWGGGDEDALSPLMGTCLHTAATHYSVQPKPLPQPPEGSVTEVLQDWNGQPIATLVTKHSDFLEYAKALHLDKDRAYGTSWKRRGELVGIMANIARKVDRLGAGGSTADETSTDTALDLMVYLAKYRTWLDDQRFGEGTSDNPQRANDVLDKVEAASLAGEDLLPPANMIASLVKGFDELERMATGGASVETKVLQVDSLLLEAYLLARHLWDQEQWKKANATRSWAGYEEGELP